MTRQVLVLGAGFAGLEVSRRLSDAGGFEVTLIDRSGSFLFGFSKLEVLLGRQTRSRVSLKYRDISMPGVSFRQESVLSIDPGTRHVVTDGGTYDPDVLVVALGADYDHAATPGFAQDGYEFYSVAGAERLRDRLATFTSGRMLIAVLSVPFKCPPAPYEATLLMHDYFVRAGVRDAIDMHVISPMAMPIPVSVETSDAIVAALGERGIGYQPNTRVRGLDPERHVALLKDSEEPYDLFIGIPTHRTPDVVVASGLTEGGNDGWVAVDRQTLATPYDGVYALGDCADAPVPRAGVFAERAAGVVAEQIINGSSSAFDGKGVCYLEFGDGRVGKVDADFLSGPSPVAPFRGPSTEYAAEKAAYAASRRQRWFGLP